MKYEYMLVAGAGFKAYASSDGSIGTMMGGDLTLLNSYTRDGWEVVKTIIHRSETHDCTSTAFLIRKLFDEKESV